MNSTRLRTVVESFYADIWNRHDKSKIRELLCEDFTFRGSLGQSKTGQAAEWSGAALFTFKGPQIADLWVLGDVHGLLQLLERNAHG